MSFESQGRVLVADDDPTSRLLLVRLLEQWGFDPIACTNGTDALRLLQEPDAARIALLDWEMPGLSGPEICRHLADRDGGPIVYTMLLTGRTEDAARIEGLQSGAHQYLRKPCDPMELRSCIEVGMRVLSYDHALSEKNELLSTYATEMERLAEERARQLLHADRMMTLGTMSAGIAHEINNSLSLIAGNAQTLDLFLPIIQEALVTHIDALPEAAQRHRYVRDELEPLLLGIRKGVGRVSATIRGLQSYSRRPNAVSGPCDLNACVREALSFCQPSLLLTTVELDLCATPPLFAGVAEEVHQVLVNLVINACHAMEDSGTTPKVLNISTSIESEWVCFRCRDSGTGLSEEVQAELWKPFFTTKEAGRGTGLGLSICQGLVENNGGRIEAANAPSGGALFSVWLPSAGDPDDSSTPEGRN